MSMLTLLNTSSKFQVYNCQLINNSSHITHRNVYYVCPHKFPIFSSNDYQLSPSNQKFKIMFTTNFSCTCFIVPNELSGVLFPCSCGYLIKLQADYKLHG
jgi:hypothetical protein